MTQAQKDEVKLHYQRATRAYDLQKYPEAIDEYQKAYEISGDPPMLYNIAQAYRLADQPAEAARYYRRFLQRMPNARNRDDVERKIADQEKLAEQRKKVEPVAAPAARRPSRRRSSRSSRRRRAARRAAATAAAAAAARDVARARGRRLVLCSAPALIVDGVAGYEGYRAKQKADQLTRDSMMQRHEDVRPRAGDGREERQHRGDRARHRRHGASRSPASSC